jgi:uncharacterized membrane protein YgcG
VRSKRCITILFVFLVLSPTLFALTCKATIVESDWIDNIESLAYDIDANTTAEIVVCVFPSLYGHGIKDNSGNEINDIVKLGVHILNYEPLEVIDGTQTGVGKSGQDNGVLIVVAIQEREWRIEVGYGLEGYLTDIETNLIAQEYLVPAFKQENYGEGLYDTVAALGENIPPLTQTGSFSPRGYYYYESDATPKQTSIPFWDYNFYGMPLWLIIVLVLIGIAAPVFGGKVKGGHSGGGGSTGKW